MDVLFVVCVSVCLCMSVRVSGCRALTAWRRVQVKQEEEAVKPAKGRQTARTHVQEEGFTPDGGGGRVGDRGKSYLRISHTQCAKSIGVRMRAQSLACLRIRAMGARQKREDSAGSHGEAADTPHVHECVHMHPRMHAILACISRPPPLPP
jgi:hypothetical protein